MVAQYSLRYDRLSDVVEGAVKVGSFSQEQLERLYHVAQAIHVTLEPAEALQRVVQESVQLVNASSGSLALVNPTTGLLEIGAAEGLPTGGETLQLLSLIHI